MTLYNLRSNPAGELPFTITKFTFDLEVESSYSVGKTVCECPAGHRLSCRHRDMLHILTTRVDTAWFWDYERKRWEDPTGQASAKVEEDVGEVEADPLPEDDEIGKDGPASFEEAMMAAGQDLNKPIESPVIAKPKLGGLRRL